MAKRSKKVTIHKKQKAKKIATTQSWQDFFNDRLITIPWISAGRKSVGEYYKPHISRFISRMVVVAILIVTVVYSLALFTENQHKTNKFQQLQQAVLTNPFGVGEHEQLGLYYENNNDFANAKKEYLLALEFGDPVAQASLSRIVQKQNAPNLVRNDLILWQRFVTEHPDYRDGQMEIAMLWWLLGDKEQANRAVENVLALDPTFLPAIQLASRLQ